METDHQTPVSSPDQSPIRSSSATRKPLNITRFGLLLPSCTCLAFSSLGGRTLLGFYYKNGGSHKWFLCLMMNIGFPLLALPISFLYRKEVSKGKKKLKEFLLEPKLFISSAVFGLMGGLNSYMYSTGMSYLPVSTATLIVSTQLAFTAFFSFIFVKKQKFSFYTVNAVALMILGALVLAIRTSGDRADHEVSKGKYLNGFFMALGTAALGGLTVPLVELSYLKSRKPVSYGVMMQFQFVMNGFSAIFATIGVIASKDLLDIPREAREHALGEVKYYMVLVMYAVLSQLSSIGFMGILYCTSSLFLGVFSVALLPITQIIAAIAFHEKYTAEKGMSLALCLWGFTSYFIGVHNRTSSHPTVLADHPEVATETAQH